MGMSIWNVGDVGLWEPCNIFHFHGPCMNGVREERLLAWQRKHLFLTSQFISNGNKNPTLVILKTKILITFKKTPPTPPASQKENAGGWTWITD